MADQTKGLGERVGNEAHDAPDTGNPVKVGGHATADVRADVAEDDRVDISCDLKGAVRIHNEKEDPLHIQGDVGASQPDSGRPVKIGGVGRITLQPSVTPGQRADLAMSQNGAAFICGSDGTNMVNYAVDANGNSTAVGNVAHDDPDAGNPLSTGFNAAEFNTDPPQVSADDDRVRGIATPQGIQWVLGGHPNLVTREYMTTASQTDDLIIDAVATGSQIIVTAISVMVSAATTVNPQVRIGFGLTNVPTEPTSGNFVANMLVSHPGIAPGSGVVEGSGAGVLAIGMDGMELRITCDEPTTGQISVIVTYYISSL